MKRSRDDGPGGGPPKRPAGPPRPAQPGRLTTNDALAYLREVKERFKDNKSVYDSFLEIMKQFKAQQIDTNGVIHQVKLLFRGHRELILGFNTFLPKGYEIQVTEEEMEPKKQPVEFDQAISYVNKIKTRFQNNERVYKAFLEILNMYRKEEKSIQEVYDEVAQLFRHHQDLLDEFTHFLPDSAPPAHRGFKKTLPAGRGPVAKGQPIKRKLNSMGVRKDGEDDPKNKAANLARELQFFERVKARLRNRDTYQEFLKCLHLFNQDIISKMELRGLVYDVLGRYPELLTGFDDFLQRCESMDFELAEAGRGKLSSKDVAKMKIISAREKFLSRPISELDLSMCERCGPSYRLLPKGFPKAPASTRNELHMSVLNDNWVSVTSGSEDFSFKAMRKNQYEESLFRCEDDRFEMDMVIETNAAVLHLLAPLYAQVQAMSAEERNAFRLAEDLLSPVHLRAVERIYGADHGPDVRELLLRAPALALAGVVPRLAQKDAEWRRVREDMRRVWADVYEKNYSKSLDHRSFYFKQADKKSLSAKGMLSEMKELSDKRKALEEGPMGGSGAPGARARGPSPDVTFSYGDRAVHDDVYAVVKFSSAEMMGDDAAAKLLQFWRSFVEPFFGVQRPSDGSPGYVDDVAERAAAAVLQEAKDEEAKEKDEAARGSGEDGDGGDAMDTDAPAAPAGGNAKDDGGKHHRSTGLAAAAADDEDGGEETLPASRRERERDEREDAGDGAASSGADEEDGSAGRRGSAGEDDAAGDAGAQARLLAGCRPLACAVDGDAARPEGRIFYGHDAFFLLFRLHRHLYERIATARASAVAKHDAAWGPGPAGDAARDKDAHSEFLHLLFRLLSGSVEASRYEDDCRALLGANSYVLFTLDKLIYKLIKQAQALLSDDTASRLLLLHEYEASRLRAPSHDAQYAANAGVLLQDEPCFRVASADAGATLQLQLLDGAPAADKAGDGGGGMLEARFADYLRGFLQTAAPKGAHKRPPPPPPSGSDEEEEPQERQVFLQRSVAPPGAVSCVNGLECKVSCATSKVSYVLDTEDVLRVRRAAGASRNAAAARAAAVSRFHAWLETKVAATPAAAS